MQIRFNVQSKDINSGVDRDDGVLGAGDQGLMFGYATDETSELMPSPIVYAHALVRRQAEVRKRGLLPWLQPDAKSQATFNYVDGRPTTIETLVPSTQHDETIELDVLRNAIDKHIMDNVIPGNLRSPNYMTLINPTGRFVTWLGRRCDYCLDLNMAIDDYE